MDIKSLPKITYGELTRDADRICNSVHMSTEGSLNRLDLEMEESTSCQLYDLDLEGLTRRARSALEEMESCVHGSFGNSDKGNGLGTPSKVIRGVMAELIRRASFFDPRMTNIRAINSHLQVKVSNIEKEITELKQEIRSLRAGGQTGKSPNSPCANPVALNVEATVDNSVMNLSEEIMDFNNTEDESQKARSPVGVNISNRGLSPNNLELFFSRESRKCYYAYPSAPALRRDSAGLGLFNGPYPLKTLLYRVLPCCG